MEKRKAKRILPVLLFAAALVALYLAFNDQLISDRFQTEPIDANSKIVEKQVNKHMQETARRIEQEQARVKAQLSTLPQVGDRVIAPESRADRHKGVDFSSDPNEDQTYRDLNRHPKEYSESRTAHAVIQTERAQQEARAREAEAEREQYVSQFIENARRQGYLVKVNSDLVVVSVQKINTSGSSGAGLNLGSGSK